MNKICLGGDSVADLIPDGENRHLKCSASAAAKKHKMQGSAPF